MKEKEKISFKDFKATRIINEIEDILNYDIDSEHKIPIIKYVIDKWRKSK